MKNTILLFCLLGFAGVAANAQSNELIGQYYLNLPAYNPAHTGTDNFLNINLGVRRQWAGFAGAPNTSFLSGYGVIKNRKDADKAIGRKHGLGGYVMTNSQGSYQQNEVSLMYAYHIPVSANTHLSLGMSPSYYTERIEVNHVSVEDVSDAAYQSLLNQGNKYANLQLNTGLSLHSDKFYLSYSLREAVRTQLSGNEDVFASTAEKRHHFMGAYTFEINEELKLIPNAFVRLDQHRPTLVELGTRATYQSNLWAGVSYRNDKTMVGSVGFLLDDKYQLGYAYEHKSFGLSQYARGTHEIILGIQLFKSPKSKKRLPFDAAPVAEITALELETTKTEEVETVPEPEPPVAEEPKAKSFNATLKSKRGELLSDGTMEVKNLSDGSTKTFLVDHGLVVLDLSPGTGYEITGTKEEYTTQTVRIPASDTENSPSDASVEIVIGKLGQFKSIAIGDMILALAYEVGKSTVKEASLPELDRLVELLTENPEITIGLGSHSDARGSDKANLALSQKRAESAVAYLVSKGIDKNRMTAIGYGETQLKVPNATTEAEHAQNRRTTVSITSN